MGYSQFDHPASGVLFADDIVTRIDITLLQDDLDKILAPENSNLNDEYPATFIFSQGSITDTVENVGFRLRGNTSRQSSKPSFKISFNTFQPGRQYRDVEKLNLNGEHNDPTIARSKTSWQVMADQGLHASRTNHIKLYINEEYRGLYLNVEHIDEEFLKKRFDDWNGNLYKCLWPADLTYISDNPIAYQFQNGGRRAYDLKTNKEQDDYSDLAHLIDVINNTPTNDLPCTLESIFDIQSYLKLVATDIFIGNWDGHLFNKNNFYLYHDPCTQKFLMIPYDLDNTFGIDWFGVDWSTSSLDFWIENHSGDRPLIDRLMSIQKYRNNVEGYLEELSQQWENNDYQSQFFALRDLLIPHRESDIYASLDYGYTVNDFKNNYTHGLPGHTKQGLVEFVDKRINSLSDQLDSEDQSVPAVEHYTIDRTESTITLSISLKFIDDENEVRIHTTIDNSMSSVSLITANNEGLYEIVFPIDNQTDQYLNWHLSISYGIAGVTRYPTCESIATRLNAPPPPSIVINEVVSSNTSGIQDEAGEYPDWIELYNRSDEVVNLGELYLTDKLDKLNLWQLPDYDLLPNSYVIIYADSDGHQGSLHSNFKLNKDGEFLALIDSKSNLNGIIDSITLPSLDSNQSYGRLPNGVGDFEELTFQSPNGNNESISSIGSNDDHLQISISPNPVSQVLNIQSSEGGTVILVSATGSMLYTSQIENLHSIDVSEYSAGVYFLKISDTNGESYTQKFIKR